MGEKTTSMRNAFLDTAFAIALVNKRDTYHDKARALLQKIEQERTSIITTQAVLIEIGNALAGPALRRIAAGYIERLEKDSSVEVVPISDELLQQGLTLYRERPDKAWGLTDCISFVVMQERGITDAMTADRHFEQAGYTAILR